MTGNVVDFAVAVILAGAVGLVVNGFVADIIINYFGRVIFTMAMVAPIVDELPENILKYIELEFPLSYAQEQHVNDLLRNNNSKRNRVNMSQSNGSVIGGNQNEPLIHSSPATYTAIQHTITYNEACEYFKPYLNRLKAERPLVEVKCPGSWRELKDLMKTAKEEGSVSKPLLKVYIKEVYDSLGWKWL